MPTPPQPITATDEPASTWAVLMAAPRPVVTPQPIRAAISNGTSSGIGTAQPAPTTTSSVKVPVPAKPKTSPPGRLKLRGARVREARQAQLGLAALAGRTLPAGGQPADEDPVAGAQAGHPVADVDDLARALVAGDEGGGLREDAAHRGDVGVAEAGGADAELDLSRAEAHRLDVVEDFELLLAYLVQYGCAHGWGSLESAAKKGSYWIQACSTSVSARTGASSRSAAVTVTWTRPSSAHIRTRRVSPGKTTPANRVR